MAARARTDAPERLFCGCAPIIIIVIIAFVSTEARESTTITTCWSLLPKSVTGAVVRKAVVMGTTATAAHA